MDEVAFETGPRISVAVADRLLAEDPRFGVEMIDVRGRRFSAWSSGPKTVEEILSLTTASSDETFLVAGSQRSDFAGFRLAVNFCAARLADAGVGPGDRVALLMRNRMEWPVVFCAVMTLGGIIVPVNGWETDEKIGFMIRTAGARHLVSDAPREIVGVDVERLWSDRGLETPLEAIVPPSATWGDLPNTDRATATIGPDDIAAIFYTSGTSGRPKGATLTHRAIAAAVRNSEYQRARYALRHPAVPPPSAPQRLAALFPVPLFHVTAAVAGLVVAMASGAKMVLMDRWDPEEAISLIARERVTLLGGVPTLPLQLLQQTSLKGADISSLTDCLYGGAPAPSSLPEDIRAGLGARSSTGWGMTETASTFLLNTGQDYLDRPSSCGLPASPVNEARIASDDDRVLAPGERGELQVRGLTVTEGYWNSPEATHEAYTADGWFRTGDIASMDAEGFVTIADRIKDVIIRGGENIYTVEIEDALAAHPDVLESAVFGRAHPTLGEEVIAAVVMRDSTIDAGGLNAFLTGRLPRHKIPVVFHRLSTPLPRNAAGKILKADLKDLVGDREPIVEGSLQLHTHAGN